MQLAFLIVGLAIGYIIGALVTLYSHELRKAEKTSKEINDLAEMCALFKAETQNAIGIAQREIAKRN